MLNNLKNYMVNCLHALYRNDKFINELFNSAGVELDKIDSYLDEIYGNNFFDTATEKGLIAFEEEAGLEANLGQSRPSREASLRAKWIGAGNATLELLQNIADSWKNGLLELSFTDGKIHVEFTSPVGVPGDLQALQNAFYYVKPAHLAIYYTFRYRFWLEVNNGTLNPYGNTWQNWLTKAEKWQGVRQESV